MVKSSKPLTMVKSSKPVELKHSFSFGAGGIVAWPPFLQSGISDSPCVPASPLHIAGLSYAEEDLAILGS
ncbi:hypothetical protein SUGI_0108610 [Cryptomeria japonica]|nr:hypothetical protein SUGI_0108610 [Cryptomeria japonica]